MDHLKRATMEEYGKIDRALPVGDRWLNSR
jgi:hypothetical protein